MSSSRGEVVKCGVLTKSPPDGKVAHWHKRWFVLADSRLVYPLADRYVRLEYFQSEVEAKKLADPKGVINLQACMQVKSREQMRGHKHVFDVCTGDRIYHLAAESAEEKNEWIVTLKDMLFTEQPSVESTGRWSPLGRSHLSESSILQLRPNFRNGERLHRPQSYSGDSASASSRPLPPPPSDHIRTRPLPPTPQQLLLSASPPRTTPPQRPPLPRSVSPRPIRRVAPGVSRSTENLTSNSPSRTQVVDISSHYEVGPGQLATVQVSPRMQRKKPPLPKPKPKIVHANSTDADYSYLKDNGEEEYSMLQATTFPTLNTDDYSHLGKVTTKASVRERHTSPSIRKKCRDYENVPSVPVTPDGDYSHLTR